MAYIRHTSKVEFKGCRHDINFQNKVDELIATIEKDSDLKYASASFKVVREGDSVNTKSKKSEGLSEEAIKIFNALEEMAMDTCKKGGDPSKVKTEIEVEREL